MKYFLLGILLLPIYLHAQINEGNQDIFTFKEIKINPIYSGIGIAQIQFEKFQNNTRSLNVVVNYINLGYWGNNTGFGIGIGQRNYLKEKNGTGYFVEPFGSYFYLENRGAKQSTNTLSTGAVLGRKWLLFNRLSFDVYLGPSINFGFMKEGTQSTQKIDYWVGPMNGIFARFGCSMGYRFN